MILKWLQYDNNSAKELLNLFTSFVFHMNCNSVFCVTGNLISSLFKIFYIFIIVLDFFLLG